MKVTRDTTISAFMNGWCPQCKAYTNMKQQKTGLPGILYKVCPNCEGGYQVNLLEDGNDLMEVPDTFVFPEE